MNPLKRALREKDQQERLIRGGRAGLRSVPAMDPPQSTRGLVRDETNLTTHDGVGTEDNTLLWGVHNWGE